MNKNERLGSYEAQKDQPQELQEALGKLAVTGDTLDLEYLKGTGRDQRVGKAALSALDADSYELAA